MVADRSSLLLSEVERITGIHGSVSEVDARRFFDWFDMPTLFGTLRDGNFDLQSLEAICSALDKLFATNVGTQLLPACKDYALAALDSSSTALRKLGAKQLGRLFQILPPGSDTTPLLQRLLSALQDEDTGVSTHAKAAIVQAAAQQKGFEILTTPSGCGSTLRDLLYTGQPTARIRALALIIQLAAQSQGNLDALRCQGLLDPLLIQLDDSQDILSCISVLQVIQELAPECQATESGAALYRMLVPHLLRLMQSSELLVQCQTIKVCCAMLSSSSALLSDGMEIDATAAVTNTIMTLLHDTLDTQGSQHVPAELLESALEGVSLLGSSKEGAELLCGTSSRVVHEVAVLALGRTAGSGVRLAALYALGSVCGSDRAGDTSLREAALLSAHAESRLQDALYAAADPPNSPITLMWTLLQQPFPDVRQGVYRVLVGLCARVWAASLVAGQRDMMRYITDPSTESTKQLCEWRYSVVNSLLATCTALCHQPLENGAALISQPLQAAAQELQQAIRQGPFGAGRSAPHVPVVATQRR